MINKLIQLLIAVFVIALIAFALDYFMVKLAVAAMWQNIVWAVFGLIVLLGLVGLFGYGPFADAWKTGAP